MKIKIRHIFLALMLCIGAFFTPVPAVRGRQHRYGYYPAYRQRGSERRYAA